jgi:hypothetical protein
MNQQNKKISSSSSNSPPYKMSTLSEYNSSSFTSSPYENNQHIQSIHFQNKTNKINNIPT